MKVIMEDARRKIVEYAGDGVSERAILPRDAPLNKTSLKRGIAYGLTLDDVEEALGRFDRREAARRLLNGLHRRGIWTKQDIRRPQAARQLQDAILEAFGLQIVDLINVFEERG